MAARKPGKEWCDWEEEKEWAGEDERVMGGRRCLREREEGNGSGGLGWVGWVSGLFGGCKYAGCGLEIKLLSQFSYHIFNILLNWIFLFYIEQSSLIFQITYLID